MLYYRYAEKYGLQPQYVPKVVTMRAFMRWLLLEKSEASREIWLRYRAAEDKQRFLRDLTKEENDLRQWAMIKGEY